MPRLLSIFLLAACAATAAEKPRIFLTESGLAEISAENISVRKGTSAENIEVMKSFQKHCADVLITNNREKATYLVRFDREGTSPVPPFTKGNKVAVFDKNEDLVFSDSSRYLTSSVKNTCAAIVRHARATP